MEDDPVASAEPDLDSLTHTTPDMTLPVLTHFLYFVSSDGISGTAQQVGGACSGVDTS